MEIKGSNGVLVKAVLISEARRLVRLCSVTPLDELSDDQIIETLRASTEIAEILKAKGFVVEM